MHDFGDYMGRYAHIGKAFSNLGYDFYGMDMRGHGNNPDLETAYISDIQILINDMNGFLN